MTCTFVCSSPNPCSSSRTLVRLCLSHSNEFICTGSDMVLRDEPLKRGWDFTNGYHECSIWWAGLLSLVDNGPCFAIQEGVLPVQGLSRTLGKPWVDHLAEPLPNSRDVEPDSGPSGWKLEAGPVFTAKSFQPAQDGGTPRGQRWGCAEETCDWCTTCPSKLSLGDWMQKGSSRQHFTLCMLWHVVVHNQHF